NVGRGVEAALAPNHDLKLIAVLTRRDPGTVTPLEPATRVESMDALDGMRDELDVLILCGGSKDDLPVQGPELAARFTTADSFDTHPKIPQYFAAVDAAARAAGTTAGIACGWDPGLFSIQRLFGEAILPDGETHTFWGRGVSQGHSDALRRVRGVAGGVQYTVPSPEAVSAARDGGGADLTTRDRHRRDCFVVLKEGADPDAVREAIVSMPDYFAPYETTVTFITADELAREHSGMPHGGFVLRRGATAPDSAQLIEFGLTLDSNPQFT
ncbi:MAG TPA: diaminopimelate dehydrogenase, partial [Miltoncostaeaceae bacterium]|nr:diaminopimelate dehydrogenase [Miltoncostaeaceae bacterium]